MDIFVEFILEKYQRIHPTIQIVGDPILPNQFEVDQPYLYFDLYTDRESSDPIPVQVLLEPENRVKKVIYKSYHNNHMYNRYYLFLEESTNKEIKIKEVKIEEDSFLEKEIWYVKSIIYEYTEEYACK